MREYIGDSSTESGLISELLYHRLTNVQTSIPYSSQLERTGRLTIFKLEPHIKRPFL